MVLAIVIDHPVRVIHPLRRIGVPLERPRMLMEVFEEHNAQMKALIGREFFASHL
jgi:hypothetical protein